MTDHYKTLGVERTASEDEIKQAFRRLAMKHHPDRGGDAEHFKRIEEAYRTLGNADSRAQYDNPRPNMHWHGAGGNFNFDDIFSMFGTQFRRPPQQARVSLVVSLRDVVTCARKSVNIATEAGTQNLDLEIPPGVEDGMQVVYQGLAPGGIDLVVQYRIAPDNRFQRQGTNLITEQEIVIWDLIRGGDVTVLGVENERLLVTVPPMTQPNALLRVRGRGVPDRSGNRGDLLVRLLARIPRSITPDLLDHVRREP